MHSFNDSACIHVLKQMIKKQTFVEARTFSELIICKTGQDMKQKIDQSLVPDSDSSQEGLNTEERGAKITNKRRLHGISVLN